jgi:aminocarboxymuconate-semialdehyde decarboxylase
MAFEIIDIFTHIFPEAYFDALSKAAPELGNLGGRLRSIRPLFDLDARFRSMDALGAYGQFLTLPHPPIEELAKGEVAARLSAVANEGLADLCARHPDRFVGFAATIALDDIDSALRELERAILQLGARGVQIYTNVAGHPLDEPRFEPIFAAMAQYDLPVWLHPARTASMPDYTSEPRSRFEMWWCFGWPYETSVAMARLVFAGIFDRYPGLKIVTHHLGGMIPYYDGRVGTGMDVLGSRTSDEDYKGILSGLKRPHLEYFRDFYADTAMFGGQGGLKCGLEFFSADRVVFASDAPLSSIPATIAAVDALNLADGDRRKIFCLNAHRLLKLAA